MVIESCHRLGLRVPHDVAVVGVNDDPVACETSLPALTSIEQDGERIGFEAARMLDQLMSGRPLEAQRISISPKRLAKRQHRCLGARRSGIDRSHAACAQAAASGLDRRPPGEKPAYLAALARAAVPRSTAMHPATYYCVRVERACELLKKRPAVRLSDVATECGFRDPRHLNLAFCQVTGQSPKQYQAQQPTGRHAS